MQTIEIKDQQFLLNTKNTSYLFLINRFGHPEQVHYGGKVKLEDLEALRYKRTIFYGSEIIYDEADPNYSLDNVLLNWSGSGKGDFRISPIELEFGDHTFISDFLFDQVKTPGFDLTTTDLPSAHYQADEAESLVLSFREAVHDLELLLIFTVFYETDVISRRTVLINHMKQPVKVHKLMSLMLDLPNHDYSLLTLNGDWNAETNEQFIPVKYGILTNQSSTGSSSNRHNPAVALVADGADQDHGSVYGFNLIYSGNHQTRVELSRRDLVRLTQGINPENFHWTLAPGETFVTPEAVMTFSEAGLNGMSRQFHRFVHAHIIPEFWQYKEKPILINNWEAHYFDYNQSKLLRLARMAKKLGIELFVLDDGWFGKRDSDLSGLGDYQVNHRKLPQGISGLADKINQLGMQFGLWFEPESVNVDSDLYRAHPEYALQMPGRKPSFGRHQLLLDITRPEVEDYIVDHIRTILDSASISYVKWDMNRHMSDVFSGQIEGGEYQHRYVLALYRILRRIFDDHPNILLEMCSSGGNRFDLGMLCFAPQIWASDNTDPIERLRIQRGLSYFYPISCMGAHVSHSPHNQTLRRTPLSTRFNVAAFGAFGYELDLTVLSKVELDQIKEQVAFYKLHRSVFQYGTFYRYNLAAKNQEIFLAVSANRSEAVLTYVNTLAKAGPPNDWLQVKGLSDSEKYCIQSIGQKVEIARFGHLINHVSPVKLKGDGLAITVANRHYAMEDGKFMACASGAALRNGICLNNQFLGTGYHPDLRLWGDFGSQLYVIKEADSV